MRELQFSINDHVIENNSDMGNIVAKSSEYPIAAFTFDREWIGCEKTAIFLGRNHVYSAPILGAKCHIPEEVAKEPYFQVEVEGKKPNGFEVKTNKLKVNQEV